MSANLLELIKGSISQQLINKAASQFGESESATTKAVESIVPSILSGLLSQSTTESGAKSILNMISDNKINANLLSNAGSLMSSPSESGSFLKMGEGIISSIFGSKMNGVVDFISNYAGIKPSSSSGLLSMVAPLALSGLMKQNGGSLNIKSLASSLFGQGDVLKAALPAGLGSVLGISSFDTLISSAKSNLSGWMSEGASTAKAAANAVEEKAASGLPKWLLPLLLLIAALGLLFFLMKGCNKKSESDATEVVATIDSTATAAADTLATKVESASTSIKAIFDSLTGTVNYDLGAIITKKLPNGVEIKIAENGAEAALINFLETGTVDTVDKTKGWINLYDVQFVKNLDYRKGAAEQIANIAAILKAYPNAKIKLGGYTDNTGSIDVNNKLSQSRADKVKADLAKLGVAAQVTKAEGYGPNHPVCEANDTPECKAQNRRVSLRVVSK